MSNNCLDAQEMDAVGEVFQSALFHVMNNCDEATQQRHLEFILSIVLKEIPYMLVTAQGVTRMNEQVWTDNVRRDFILTLAYVFFARLGGDLDLIKRLCSNLARGCSILDVSTTEKTDYAAVPQDVSDRLADLESAEKVINANKWLMMLLLLQLYVSVPKLQPVVSKRNSSTGDPKS